MAGIVDRLVRVAATAAHGVLKAVWFARRPKTFGAHAIALTPEGRVVLVRLRYAPGWRLPGGGRSPTEDPREAALRELREEIGMHGHGEVSLACELQEATNFKRDTASVVIVRDVRYRPHGWSWEVEQVGEADLAALPKSTSPQTRRWLRIVAARL